jgi:hypothetical protein
VLFDDLSGLFRHEGEAIAGRLLPAIPSHALPGINGGVSGKTIEQVVVHQYAFIWRKYEKSGCIIGLENMLRHKEIGKIGKMIHPAQNNHIGLGFQPAEEFRPSGSAIICFQIKSECDIFRYSKISPAKPFAHLTATLPACLWCGRSHFIILGNERLPRDVAG